MEKSQVLSSGEFFGFFGGHPDSFLVRVYFYTLAYAQSFRFFSEHFSSREPRSRRLFLYSRSPFFPSVISYNGDKFYQALDR
jgi:hypothetical protein